jgi:hypothetical protein
MQMLYSAKMLEVQIKREDARDRKALIFSIATAMMALMALLGPLIGAFITLWVQGHTPSVTH